MTLLISVSSVSREFQTEDAHDNKQDGKQLRPCGGIREQDNAENGRTDRADAGPHCICRTDRKRSQRLAEQPETRTIAAPVSTLGSGRVNPSVYFRPIAQPTSRRPATKRYVQAMFISSSGESSTLVCA